MTTAAAFADLRSLMFSIAYRMLSSAVEAEDIVQDAFLRYHRALAEGTVVESPKAFLSAVTTRLSIDHLRSAKVRRESYGGGAARPLLTDRRSRTRRAWPAADSLSMAFLLVLERLHPVEQAVFLLQTSSTIHTGDRRNRRQDRANCRQMRPGPGGTWPRAAAVPQPRMSADLAATFCSDDRATSISWCRCSSTTSWSRRQWRDASLVAETDRAGRGGPAAGRPGQIDQRHRPVPAPPR
jgi:hypothetical protein